MTTPPTLDPAAASTPVRHTFGRIARNTIVLALGRNAVALSRLVVVVVIARAMGAEAFGEYAVLIALLTVAEGVLDFGTTEVYVREILARPDRRAPLLRVLTAGRIVQVPAAMTAVMIGVLLLQHPSHIVQAAAVGSLSLVFLAGVMVFRVIFRADLTMERDIAAELVSVTVMIAGVWWASRHDGGVVAVMLSHVVSRAVYFVVAAYLARHAFRLSTAGVSLADLRHSAQQCAAIGAAGFFVMLYDPLDVLLLSKLGSITDTAEFSAAQRLSWPVLMALSAVGGTLYSVLSTAWTHDRPRFNKLCQRGLDAVLVLGGAAAAALLAGAEFLMSLLGPTLVDGAGALRVLAVLCVVKAVSMTIGPVLLIVKAQRAVLVMIALALVLKVLLMLWVAPRYGALGVASAALVVEIGCLLLPLLVLVRRRAGLHLRAGTALRVVALVAVSVAASTWLLQGHRVLPLLAAPAIYVGLALLSGTLHLAELRGLRRAGRAAPAAAPASTAPPTPSATRSP